MSAGQEVVDDVEHALLPMPFITVLGLEFGATRSPILLGKIGDLVLRFGPPLQRFVNLLFLRVGFWPFDVDFAVIGIKDDVLRVRDRVGYGQAELCAPCNLISPAFLIWSSFSPINRATKLMLYCKTCTYRWSPFRLKIRYRVSCCLDHLAQYQGLGGVVMSDLFWFSETQTRQIEPYFPLSHSVPRVDGR